MLHLLKTALFILALVAAVTACGRTDTAVPGTTGGQQSRTMQEELAELNELRAPDGVDTKQFAELKQSLGSLLTAKAGEGGRIVSAPPQGAAGAVADLHFGATGDGVLSWTYVNRGDYDQNSEVNGADIVPIAAHFRKNTASPDWLSRAVSVDGDANGEVNGADIVPIAGNFRGRVEGYRIEVSADGTGGWSLAASAPFSASSTQGAWRVFAHELTSPQHENWYRVVPFEGAALGAPSNAVQYAAPTPQIVSVSPQSGREGADVQFSATVSGPAPDTYSWDFGGGANPDSSSEQSPTVTLSAPGSYGASLTVSNAVGEHTFPFMLTVNANQPPTASFTAMPQSGAPGEEVQLDASASFDPDGSIVRYEWDLDGDSVFETDAGDNPTLDTTLPDPAGTVDVSLRVTDDSGATHSATLTLSSANQPPVASFTATPQNGDPGEPVSLDASASSDLDGSIVQYEWDLDGDGSYETHAAGNPLQATALPDPAGTVSVGLRVTDDLGAQDTTNLDLTSSDVGGGTWLKLTVDAPGDVGYYSSLAVINGRPAISYYDDINEDLRYAYSSEADGSSGWTTIAVDTTGSVGYSTSLAVVNGKPAISYYDWTNQALKYAYSSTADGSSGWTTLTVDAAGDVGWFSSLAVVNDKPAISYYDFTNADLKYAYSSEADGSSGWTTLTVDDSGGVGSDTSLAVVNDKPAISYRDLDNQDLKYAYSSTADGSSGWASLTVDAPGNVGFFTSLALVEDKPAISYRDETNEDLKYAYSSAADGSSGWTTIAVDTAGDVARFTSLALVDGKPAISYYDVTNRDLKFASSTAADGSSGWSSIIVDAPGSVGTFTSLVMLTNGRPAISYYDITEADLKYAVLMP